MIPARLVILLGHRGTASSLAAGPQVFKRSGSKFARLGPIRYGSRVDRLCPQGSTVVIAMCSKSENRRPERRDHRSVADFPLSEAFRFDSLSLAAAPEAGP